VGQKRLPGVIDAVHRGDLSGLAERLDAGEAVDATDTDGRTALMHAVLDGQIDAVRFLLSRGASVDARDRNGYTPLHFAAQENELEIARLLLEAGASVDPQDVHGNTPLWRAVFSSRGRGDMIGLLLARGADRHLKNKSGVSPYELSRTIGNYDVARFL
jgi:ankyrin repeat protein